MQLLGLSTALGAFIAGQAGVAVELVGALFVGVGDQGLVQTLGDEDGSLALAAVQHGKRVIAQGPQLGLIAEHGCLAIGKELRALLKALGAARGVLDAQC